MIKCEKGIVTIVGQAPDVVDEWTELTAHMVAELEKEVKKIGEVTIEKAIEMVEKEFKEDFKRSLIAAEIANDNKLEKMS